MIENWASPNSSQGKESTRNGGDTGDASLIPALGKSPGEEKWQPAPVFFPEKSHGQRSLEGYSPKGQKESYMTERLSTQPCRFVSKAVSNVDLYLISSGKI